MRTRSILLCLFLYCQVVADDVPFSDQPGEAQVPVGEEPWFTGPLIAPSGDLLPPGTVEFEPYIYCTAYTGNYDSHWNKVNQTALWNVNFSPFIEIGITKWMQIAFQPSWYFNTTSDVWTNGLFGDFFINLQFALLEQSNDNYLPSIRLALQEVFPTGRYNHLDPEKEQTDISGTGSYVTGIQLTLSRSLHLSGIYWLNLFLSGLYNVPARVTVNGFHFYGGGLSAQGWVYPPQNLQINGAIELNLSKRWALACDALAIFYQPFQFKGNPLPVPLITRGSSVQYSIAPEVEYNLSENLGFISGVWFTFAGRNTLSFASWVTAFNGTF